MGKMRQPVWFVCYACFCVCVCASEWKIAFEGHVKQQTIHCTVGPKPQQVKQTQMKVGFVIIQCTVVCALRLWPGVTGQCHIPVEEAILWKEELLTFFISA